MSARVDPLLLLQLPTVPSPFRLTPPDSLRLLYSSLTVRLLFAYSSLALRSLFASLRSQESAESVSDDALPSGSSPPEPRTPPPELQVCNRPPDHGPRADKPPE
eukprot:3947565-Pyramimonas_sp.AAC.2